MLGSKCSCQSKVYLCLGRLHLLRPAALGSNPKHTFCIFRDLTDLLDQYCYLSFEFVKFNRKLKIKIFWPKLKKDLLCSTRRSTSSATSWPTTPWRWGRSGPRSSRKEPDHFQISWRDKNCPKSGPLTKVPIISPYMNRWYTQLALALRKPFLL